MESKKPRLELLIESDYEDESESDSEESLSDYLFHTSSLFRSPSSLSLASVATSFSTPNLPTVMTPRVSSLTNPNIFSSAARNVPIYSVRNERPLSTPNLYSAAASRLYRPAIPNLRPPEISIPSSLANPNVFPFATPNVPPSSPISNFSSTSNVPPLNMPSSTAFLGAPHEREQIRSTLRSACEAVNHELDSLMQPSTSKQQTLNGIDAQLAEGAASNVPGPSRVVQNCDGTCWMRPVNPFTSNMTQRQHLQGANHSNVRPRRRRPPPGIHPTPQNNVLNLGASGSGIGRQSFGVGVVRPPPGFQSNSASNRAVPGSSTTLLQDSYGFLDTQAILSDLYRQSLSVVRQNATLALAQSAAHNASMNYDWLLHSMVLRQRQEAELERRASSYLASQRHRGTPLFPSNSMRSAPSSEGNELWEHLTNEAAAAAASGSGIDPNGVGYWDDFLQREVYGNAISDQYSELWKQFEDYCLDNQEVLFAPESLRTGTTNFPSANTGASKYGAVGHSRPRNQPQAQSRPTGNINIRGNFDHLGVPQHISNPDQFSQESATTSGNGLPRNRSAMLGALLHRRLQERMANASPAATSANASATRSASSAATPSTNTVSNTIADGGVASCEGRSDTAQRNMSVGGVSCLHCAQEDKAAGLATHVLRDTQGRAVCPIHQNKPCSLCKETEDNGHTDHDCPIRKQWDKTGKGSA